MYKERKNGELTLNKNEFLEMSLAKLPMWLLEQGIEEMEWDVKSLKRL